MSTKKGAKAVIYVRVSSAAQVAKGHGAESQATRCEHYAQLKGYEVLKVFEDKGVSGSLIERPGMQRMLAYLRQHRGEGIRVLIDDISRLARGLEAHLALRAALIKVGAELESPSVEFGTDGDGLLIERMLALMSEHGRLKIAETTRNRQEARLRGGYWPFIGCMGFRTEERDGHGKILVRDEPLASILQEGMEGYASGRFQTQAEVKRFFESRPEFPRDSKGQVRNQLVNDILTKPLYAGMVGRPQWGVPLHRGKHEGLIDFATFEKIQARLKGRSYAAARPDVSADFPLRGSICCGDCDHLLTACWSTSKTGDRHPYYWCNFKGCPSYRKSIRRVEIEGAFEQMLDQVQPSASLIRIAKAMFADGWEMQRRNAQATAEAFRHGMAKVDGEIAKLVERLVATSTEAVVEAYERRIGELEREKLVLAERYGNAGKPLRPFEEMFELAWSFLVNPSNIWKSGRLEDKQTVIRLVYGDRLPYARNQGFRTPKMSPIFSALEALKTGNFSMAEREGFEPSEPLRAQRFSRPPRSTTPAPLRRGGWRCFP